jgi:streptogramin lyase
VTRIDAVSRKASQPLQLAAGQVLALAAGGGAVYAAVSRTELNDDLRLLRVDPKAAKVTGAPVPITGGIPLRLAAGNGSVWATDIGSSLPGSAARAPGLLRVDPATRSAKTVAAIPGRPSSVATGPGAVWVTDSTRGTLTRVGLR